MRLSLIGRDDTTKLDFNKNEKRLLLIYNFGKFGAVPDKMLIIVDFSRITEIVDHI